MALRNGCLRIVIERQPSFLLRFGRQRQVANARRVDLLGAVKLADARQQIAKRQDALDGQFGHPERHGNFVGRPAFLDQPRERFPLRHLVGRKPRKVFNQRGFESGGIVARLHDRAGQRFGNTVLVCHGLRGEKAAASRHNFECGVAAIGPHQQRHDNAARANGWQNTTNVRRLLAAPHIGG